MARINDRNTLALPRPIDNDHSYENPTEGSADRDDGKPWSVMDIVDLDNHARAGPNGRLGSKSICTAFPPIGCFFFYLQSSFPVFVVPICLFSDQRRVGTQGRRLKVAQAP